MIFLSAHHLNHHIRSDANNFNHNLNGMDEHHSMLEWRYPFDIQWSLCAPSQRCSHICTTTLLFFVHHIATMHARTFRPTWILLWTDDNWGFSDNGRTNKTHRRNVIRINESFCWCYKYAGRYICKLFTFHLYNFENYLLGSFAGDEAECHEHSKSLYTAE